MKARYIWMFGLCFTSFSFASDVPPRTRIKDLRLGEAFFYAYQGKNFEAITLLQTEFGPFYGADEPNVDALQLQANYPGFSVREIEFSYRMYQRAELAIESMSSGDAGHPEWHELAYRLARLYVQKNEPKKALRMIEKISGQPLHKIRDEDLFLRAQIYLANEKFAEAVQIFQAMEAAKKLDAFAAYNLGMALIRTGQEKKGLAQLDKLGLLASDDEPALAIRDKVNVVLGYRLLENGQPGSAKQYLDRVRLSGPFSNKALLGSGWADINLGDYEHALVPWSVLIKRNVTDKTVQESMLGVPYAYAKLNLHGTAATLYSSALEVFDRELAKLDKSIKSVREGKFLRALVREELNHDGDWVVNLRALPESPETYYLLELMASNDFQEVLKNFHDLDDLQKRLASWTESLPAFQDMIDSRRKFYKPILPGVDKRMKLLDPQIKAAHLQRLALDDLSREMRTSPRPDLLQTDEETKSRRILRNKSRAFEDRRKGDTRQATEQVRIRLRRLDGLITWQIFASYDTRLADANAGLMQLDVDDDNLGKIHDSLQATREAATQGYEGYDDQISQLMTRVRDSRDKVKTLFARQGHLLEEMANNELGVRRKRLEEYQVQAIFAQGQSYDQARKPQNKGGAGK